MNHHKKTMSNVDNLYGDFADDINESYHGIDRGFAVTSSIVT